MEKRSFVSTALILLCLGGSMIFLNLEAFSQDLSDSFGIGLFAGPVKMIGGECDRSTIEQWGGMTIAYNLDRSLAFNACFAYGWVHPKAEGQTSHFKSGGVYKTLLYPFEINLVYKFLPQSKIRPLFSFGTGIMVWDIRKIGAGATTFSRGVTVNGSQFNASVIGGVGVDFLVYQRFVLNLMVNYHRLMKGDEDTIGYGNDGNTAVAELRFGVSYYFPKQRSYSSDRGKIEYDLPPDQGAARQTSQEALTEPDTKHDAAPDSVDTAPDAPPNLEPIPAEQESPGDENETITAVEHKFVTEPEPAQMTVGSNIILHGINFASASARLDPETYPVLDDVFQTLVDYPEMEIEIRGYTDNVGDFAANKALSERRALAVKKYLSDQGIDPKRIRAVGFGELDPIDTNSTSEGRKANRRIEFVRIK